MCKFFIINSETISEFLPVGIPVSLSTTGVDISSIENDDVLIGYNNRKQQFHCHYQVIKDASGVKLVKQLDKIHGVSIEDVSNFIGKYLSSILSPMSICEIDEALGIKLLMSLYRGKCPIKATNKHTTLLDVYKSIDLEKRKKIFKNYLANSDLKSIDKYLLYIQPDCFSGILSKYGNSIYNVEDSKICEELLLVTEIKNDKKLLFAGKKITNDGTTQAAVNKYMKFLEYLERAIDKYNYSKTLQQIIFGAPGTGKSYSINKTIGNNVNVDIFGVEADLPKEKDGEKYIIPDKMIFRTTFHPEYDYAQFVGCYKPIVADEDGKEVTYQFVPQVFTDAYVEAWNNPNKPVFLVIEEINRGNCAQIFGDIFQLLDRNKSGESEYSIQPDKDLQKYLSEKLEINDPNVDESIRNGEALLLPKNFNILATMNTSDQSLYPMDSAFKRRWDWKYTPTINKPAGKSNDFKIYFGDNDKSDYCNWIDFIRAVNSEIFRATKSEDKQLGEYFIKESICIDKFISKVMFYLWADICKENYQTKDNFFRTAKDKDERDKNKQFTFNELVSEKDENDEVFSKADRLRQFMNYLGVTIKTGTSKS